jgi:hypothetical protein
MLRETHAATTLQQYFITQGRRLERNYPVATFAAVQDYYVPRIRRKDRSEHPFAGEEDRDWRCSMATPAGASFSSLVTWRPPWGSGSLAFFAFFLLLSFLVAMVLRYS